MNPCSKTYCLRDAQWHLAYNDPAGSTDDLCTGHMQNTVSESLASVDSITRLDKHEAPGP